MRPFLGTDEYRQSTYIIRVFLSAMLNITNNNTNNSNKQLEHENKFISKVYIMPLNVILPKHNSRHDSVTAVDVNVTIGDGSSAVNLSAVFTTIYQPLGVWIKAATIRQSKISGFLIGNKF